MLIAKEKYWSIVKEKLSDDSSVYNLVNSESPPIIIHANDYTGAWYLLEALSKYSID